MQEPQMLFWFFWWRFLISFYYNGIVVSPFLWNSPPNKKWDKNKPHIFNKNSIGWIFNNKNLCKKSAIASKWKIYSNEQKISHIPLTFLILLTTKTINIKSILRKNKKPLRNLYSCNVAKCIHIKSAIYICVIIFPTIFLVICIFIHIIYSFIFFAILDVFREHLWSGSTPRGVKCCC